MSLQWVALGAALSIISVPAAFGATAADEPAAAAAAAARDPLGRDTPKGTVLGFIRAATDLNYQRAAQYIDATHVPKPLRERIDQLIVVLNQSLPATDIDRLSTRPEGSLDEDLPPNQERVGEVRYGSATLDILLERVERKDQPAVWRFSAATLKEIPAAYQQVQPRWVEQFLWAPLKDTRYMNVPLYQWLALPIAIVLVLLFARLLSRAVFLVLRPLVFRLTGESAGNRLAHIMNPVRVVAASAVIALWLNVAQLPLLSRFLLALLAFVIGVVGSAWLLTRLVDLSAELVEARLRRQHQPGRVTVSQLVAKLGKVLIVVIAAFTLLHHFDVDLTAALAGLGIGGIAIAFAAQKTLENLFGGIMIISDQPVRVGDFCKVGEVSGIIESIGLRSTRIRTLDRTLVSIPNAQMSTESLENFGFREKIRFQPTLALRYQTAADQLRFVLAETRRLLYEHPLVETATARVRFVRLGASSLDLEIFAYVLTGENARFLEVQEDLLLRIMEIVEGSGSGFAFPSTTTYVARDAGLDAEKTRAAVATVERWRAQRELPFPDFHPSRISGFKDRIEYPPAGSDRGKPAAP